MNKNPTFTFKTEMEMKTTAEEFSKFLSEANKHHVKLADSEENPRFLKPFPGGWPLPINHYLPKPRQEEFEHWLRQNIGINGGIREPHLHVDREIAFVDKDTFKRVVMEAATFRVGEMVEELEDFNQFGEYLKFETPMAR
ncbi:MAG: hypothetical protein QNK37_21830 [Acidobacteriota bacterium]|nr:hypothetical protein [Acidobacteriota bacterium]